MGDQERLWQKLKSRYLRQVRKALARTRHPRRREILEEVEAHLDQRYTDLDQCRRTREGLVAIIEQMGPATDFAELLEPAPLAHAARRRSRLKYLCSAGLAAAVVLAVVLIAVALAQEKVTYVVGFKAVAPFHPQTAAELLAAFNEKCPGDVPTHHFRTKVEGSELIGLICVDAAPAKDKLIELLQQPGRLEPAGVRALTEEDFQAHCALGQPSLEPSGAASTYVVTFRAVAPFAPPTGRELLDAFNANQPRGVRTHHFHTQAQEGRLIGQICVDTEAGKDAVVSMLKASDKLQLVKAELADERSLEALYRRGQPGLKGAGGGSNAADRARSPRTLPEPRASGSTISRTGEWPAGECSLGGTVSRRVWPTRIDHGAVCLSGRDYGSWTVEVERKGNFSFENLPQGTYTLKTVDTAGYKDTYFNPRNSAEQPPSFPLTPGRRVTARMEIEPTRPYRTILGTLRDETGQSLTGCTFLQVDAWVQRQREPWKGHFQRLSSARVAPDGSYTLTGLDGRPVYIQVWDSRPPTEEHPYPPCFHPGTFSRTKARLVTFDDAEVLRGLDITTRQTGGLVLEGVVTDETRGAPVPEALVSIFHQDMPFDLFYAYTDKQGWYRLSGLGDGTFLVHVDAVHQGHPKTRKIVTLAPDAAPTRLDFTLRPGVQISGAFVDEQGQPYAADGIHGSVSVEEGGMRIASNFPYGNKYAPDHIRDSSTVFSEIGEGDQSSAMMTYPTKTAFLVPAVMPGRTLFHVQGARVVRVLHEGREIPKDGLVTTSGQQIQDVTIIVAPAGR
jgi:hypothetical protein